MKIFSFEYLFPVKNKIAILDSPGSSLIKNALKQKKLPIISTRKCGPPRNSKFVNMHQHVPTFVKMCLQVLTGVNKCCFSRPFFKKNWEFLRLLERKKPEFCKTHPTFVFSPLLVPYMAHFWKPCTMNECNELTMTFLRAKS